MRTSRPALEALAGPAGALAPAGRGAILLAGAAAGIAFVGVEALSASVLIGAAPGMALRNVAAAAMAGHAPAGILTLAVAGMLTIAVAVAYGALVAVVARRYAGPTACWAGAASGLTVYVVNFYYLLAPALRWIGEVRDQVSVLSPWYLVSLWP
jgi:hypothetical protein